MTSTVERTDASTSPPAAAPDPSAAPSADVVAVADSVTALFRAFGRTRSRLLAHTEHDIEWSAHLLLKTLASGGPMRAGELAAHLQFDPSTVSRQVAALVKEGLLERRADPDDGRASVLHVTDRAQHVLHHHEQIRTELFGEVVQGWTDEDLRRFATYLERFARDYDTTATTWLTERLARPQRAGSDYE